MSMNIVPADVLLEIADYLSCPSEILHLYLTSSRIADALTPALYSRIVLRGPAQCIHTLDMLYARPDRARHVRSLSVCPDTLSARRGTGSSSSRWGRSALPDAYAVSSAVLGVARHLEVLQCFVWDGEELPPYDDMWFALRIFCPRLKFISTTLGSILPSPNSHLFDFSDLFGFSLTFKSGFYWQNDGVSRGTYTFETSGMARQAVLTSRTISGNLDEPIPGYHRLWEMLIKRCPNLEHLTVDGHSPHAPVDAHGLLHGRWPNLRSLLIGDVVLDWHINLNSALGKPFRTFLEAHRNLESLHLQSHAPSVASPSILSDLQADALAKVTTFSGALVQAQVLPARESLKTLRVPDAMILRDSTQLSVSASLGSLPALSSLTIAFRLEQGYDNGSALRTIIAACPHLRHLDFTVACRPSFTIETFARCIRPLAQLRTLALRIVPSQGEVSLSTSGARLVRASPRLESFELVFLPRSPNSTFSLATPTLPISRPQQHYPMRAQALFSLSTDAHGLPLALHVVERRARLFWPAESVRRSTIDMRPAGAPGTHRPPLLALVLERSPAGEEARLLLFCTVLLSVVVWGCITL